MSAWLLPCLPPYPGPPPNRPLPPVPMTTSDDAMQQKLSEASGGVPPAHGPAISVDHKSDVVN